MRRHVAWLVAFRGVLLLAAMAGTTHLLWSLVREPLRTATQMIEHGSGGLAGLPFVVVLTAGCGCVVLAGWTWMVLTSSLLVAQTVLAGLHGTRRPPGSVADRLCPRPARRIVLAACGLAITAGLGAPAVADPTGPGDPPANSLAGLALPDRAVGTASTRTGTASVTVAAGDTLWAIAERSLPPDASDYQITVAWHRLHRANADAIGIDPDQIFPGTRLRLPRFGTRATHRGEDNR